MEGAARASSFSPKPPQGTAAAAVGELNMFSIVSEYVDRVIPPGRAMKVLLVDSATLHTVSMACSQTALLHKSVFLVDSVTDHGQRGQMKNLCCVVFIRPDSASVDAACRELQAGKYRQYSIVFSAAATPEFIERLARADVDLLVDRVEEVFCDFCAINVDAFTIELAAASPTAGAGLLSSAVANAHVRRIAEGLAAQVVALRRRPHIRVQQSSPYARRVATELASILRSDPELYDYRSREATLLILDRSDDPVTALLTPWTYQAMLHEYVGLTHNTLRLPPGVKGADEDGYVFSQQDDLFFAANMFSNYGDLCRNVKVYVEKCKTALNLDRDTATLEEMKRYMEKIAETKSLAGSVSKHATVTTYLSSLVQRRDLLKVSLLEQNMVASTNATEHWAQLEAFAARADIDPTDLTRLCLLYHLKYEKAGQPSRTTAILDRVNSLHAGVLRKLREYYGVERRTEELFPESGGVMASLVKNFVEVENVYTQHEPVLKRTLGQLFSGRLDQDRYPYLSPQPAPASAGTPFKAREAVVFMCGGFTFAEAALVNAVNAGTAFKPSDSSQFTGGGGGVRAIIGGERVLNSSSFLKLLTE